MSFFILIVNADTKATATDA